jgi:hypothetical protein
VIRLNFLHLGQTACLRLLVDKFGNCTWVTTGVIGDIKVLHALVTLIILVLFIYLPVQENNIIFLTKLSEVIE